MSRRKPCLALVRGAARTSGRALPGTTAFPAIEEPQPLPSTEETLPRGLWLEPSPMDGGAAVALVDSSGNCLLRLSVSRCVTGGQLAYFSAQFRQFLDMVDPVAPATAPLTLA